MALDQSDHKKLDSVIEALFELVSVQREHNQMLQESLVLQHQSNEAYEKHTTFARQEYETFDETEGNRKYHGFIDIQDENGMNTRYIVKRPNGVPNFASYSFGECVDYWDNQIGQKIKVELVGLAYRVYTEE